jgi:hypothetical protein
MPPPSSVASQNRAREARVKTKQSLISELGLAEGIDPRVAGAIFSRVPDPRYKVSVPGQYRGSRAATKKETESFFREGYQAELAKIGQPQIAEAIAAGSDPRTIEALTSKLVSTYTTPKLKGIARGSDQGRRIRRDLAVAEQTQDLKGVLASDAARQASLVGIRRAREKAVEQSTIGMTRKRGKASLLSSQAGGAGFFQRYFG